MSKNRNRSRSNNRNTPRFKNSSSHIRPDTNLPNSVQVRKNVGSEIGRTGTPIFAGYPKTDYNQELAFPNGINIWDKMYRSDTQIKAILGSMTNPIRETRWFVAPAEKGKAAQNKEVADFVQFNLFEGMKYGWDDTLSEVLTFLQYGFSVFEIVWRFDTYQGRSVVMLDKLAPRVQQSVLRFPQDEKTLDIVSVEQWDQTSGQTYQIPLDRCVVFTNERRGSDITGISVLRQAYRNWWTKDGLNRIMTVGIEKSLLGIPMAKMPRSSSETEKNDMLDVLSSARVSEDSAITYPDGVEVSMLESRRTPIDAMPFLKYQDEQMAKSVMATFLEMGGSNQGSWALGRSMIDLFCMSLEGVAKYVAEQIQKRVIDRLVEMNFGTDVPKPKLRFKSIAMKDKGQLAQSIYWLGQAHMLTPDMDMENELREEFGFSPLTEDVLRNQQALPPNRYVPLVIPDGKLPTSPKQTPQVQKQDQSTAQSSSKVGFSESVQSFQSVQGGENKGNQGEGNGKEPESDPAPSGSASKWRRELTQHERIVDLDEHEKKLNTAEQVVLAALLANLSTVTNGFADFFAQNRTEGLQLPDNMQYAPAIAKEVADSLDDLYKHGFSSASSEAAKVSPDSPSNFPPQTSDFPQKQADTLTQSWLTKIANIMALTIIGAQARGLSSEQAIQAAKIAGENAGSSSSVSTDVATAVSNTLNAGRQAAFVQSTVSKFQYSAILDSHTCKLCADLDGNVVSASSPEFQRFQPPLHMSCRCMWIPVSSDTPESWVSPDEELVKKNGRFVPPADLVSEVSNPVG